VSLPVSGLLLQHLYLAQFPTYYHFSGVTACDLEKSFIFDNKVQIKTCVRSPIYV